MTLETMQAVVDELTKRGIRVTLEYPGFINADDILHFGDASDTLSYDILDADGQPEGGEDSDIPRDSEDVQRIADWIACTVTEFAVNAGGVR